VISSLVSVGVGSFRFSPVLRSTIWGGSIHGHAKQSNLILKQYIMVNIDTNEDNNNNNNNNFVMWNEIMYEVKVRIVLMMWMELRL
jgi:hypothetical protein